MLNARQCLLWSYWHALISSRFSCACCYFFFVSTMNENFAAVLCYYAYCSKWDCYFILALFAFVAMFYQLLARIVAHGRLRLFDVNMVHYYFFFTFNISLSYFMASRMHVEAYAIACLYKCVWSVGFCKFVKWKHMHSALVHKALWMYLKRRYSCPQIWKKLLNQEGLLRIFSCNLSYTHCNTGLHAKAW